MHLLKSFFPAIGQLNEQTLNIQYSIFMLKINESNVSTTHAHGENLKL